MNVHLIDGTYELFRHFYALPSEKDASGHEIAVVHGVVGSIRGLIAAGATHVAVATDTVIESFRNQLWPGYKTGEGIVRISGRSFQNSNGRFATRELRSGRWLSSRPTMRWRHEPQSRPATRGLSACSSALRTRISRSA